ncbi:MAG TPA: plastocyanin/azurin family copper-binding protein [Nitrosopumilaceae archaeon]|nr:plastocyanin/azurin family copper-binding protein [Nitrosopumilaceae archaeon]
MPEIRFCILGLILTIGFSIFIYPSFADTQVIIPLGASNTNTPYSLSPSVLDVKTNETITWQNNDVSSHTVTTGTTSLGFDGRIDSGVITSGKSFSYKFDKAGVYGYYCLFHPWMTGVVNVGSSSKVQPVDTISFSTDKSSYHNGDSILISGKVSNFIPNEQVTVWITNLQGIAVAIAHVETESSDDFSTSIPSGGGLWEFGNTYKVYAQYGSRSSVASTDISFEPQIYTKVNVSQITLAPLKQIKSGISVDNVQCDTDLVLVIKTEDGSPACVKSDTATKLFARGWSQSTSGSDQTSNQIVTLAQNNQEIHLKKGESFLLKLGNNYNWNTDITDQTIVSRVINIMVINGAQRIYEAHNIGTVTLTAQGDPFCLSSIPRCAMSSILFRVNIIVT